MHNKFVVIQVDEETLMRIKHTSKTLGTTQSQVISDAIRMYQTPVKEDDGKLVTSLTDQRETPPQQQTNTKRVVPFYWL